MMALPDAELLPVLRARLRTILPDGYEVEREEVRPKAMGSAGLRFRPDGSVAWDEIWTSFCHLAMAGGPPHKGSLLEPGSAAEITAEPGRYAQAVDEICRGIGLVTGLEAERSGSAGWVRVECGEPGMADWLTRAITIENVSVRCDGNAIRLPAGPGYRLEKEIKNVVTVMAKTCHYWRDHMSASRRREVSSLFEDMARSSPVIGPAWDDEGTLPDGQRALASRMRVSISQLTGLACAADRYPGWLGIDCVGVGAALARMRWMVALNVLVRREEAILFVPVNAQMDPEGARVVDAFSRVHRLASGAVLSL